MCSLAAFVGACAVLIANMSIVIVAVTLWWWWGWRCWWLTNGSWPKPKLIFNTSFFPFHGTYNIRRTFYLSNCRLFHCAATTVSSAWHFEKLKISPCVDTHVEKCSLFCQLMRVTSTQNSTPFRPSARFRIASSVWLYLKCIGIWMCVHACLKWIYKAVKRIECPDWNPEIYMLLCAQSQVIPRTLISYILSVHLITLRHTYTRTTHSHSTYAAYIRLNGINDE